MCSDKFYVMVFGWLLWLFCVDDNLVNLLLVQILFSDFGVQVIVVDSGYVVFEVVQCECFDLVFMDVQMFGMDGCQVIEVICCWEVEWEVSLVLVIVFIVYVFFNEKCVLLQVGMDDYLIKLIDEQ